MDLQILEDRIASLAPGANKLSIGRYTNASQLIRNLRPHTRFEGCSCLGEKIAALGPALRRQVAPLFAGDIINLRDRDK